MQLSTQVTTPAQSPTPPVSTKHSALEWQAWEELLHCATTQAVQGSRLAHCPVPQLATRQVNRGPGPVGWAHRAEPAIDEAGEVPDCNADSRHLSVYASAL